MLMRTGGYSLALTVTVLVQQATSAALNALGCYCKHFAVLTKCQQSP